MESKVTDFGVTQEEIGRMLAEQRRRIGLSQADIAKPLGYKNINFISMIESGKSKIPINRVGDLVEAYQMNPEFILVVLRVEYPEYLTTITSLVKRIPRIFKEVITDCDGEVNSIYMRVMETLTIK